jgi:hypothetical protein
MKSCIFLANHYRKLNDFGGQRSRYLSQSLKKKFNQVFIILPSVEMLTGKKLSKKISSNRLRFIYIWTIEFEKNNFVKTFMSQLIYSINVLFLLIYLRFKTRYLLINNNPAVQYFFLGPLIKLLKYKYIIDQRDIPFDIIIYKFKLMKFLYLIHNFIYKSSSGTISNSFSIKKKLTKNRYKDFNIELGFDNNVVLDKDVVKKINLNQCKMVYIGSFNNYMNLDHFIKKLYKNNFNGTIDIFSNKNPFSKEFLNKFTFVNYRGFLPKNKLNKVLRKFDIGIFPLTIKEISHYLLGNKIFDYLGAGLPVVTPCNFVTESKIFLKRIDCNINESYIYKRKKITIRIKKKELINYLNVNTLKKFDKALKLIF